MSTKGKQQHTTERQKSRDYSKRKKQNSIMEEQSKTPQHQDQAKRVHWHKSIFINIH